MNTPHSVLSLGTFKLRGESCYEIVHHALVKGLYTYIDTATCYHNHCEIGRAIKDSHVPRSNVFITSKIAPREMGFQETLQATEKILKELDTHYIDLLLVHWPGKSRIPGDSPEHFSYRLETWKALEQLYEQGVCHQIGVSNFQQNHLEGFLPHCRIRPTVNQVEFHPHCYQKDLLEYCKLENIRLDAYATLGNGQLLNHPIVLQVAHQLNRTPAQVLIRWGLQHGVGAMVKASSISRIEENSLVFDFSLSPEQMDELNNLHTNQRYCWDPTLIS